MSSSKQFSTRWNDKNMYKNHPDVKTKIERGCKEAGASLKRAGKNFDTLTIFNGPHASKSDKHPHITFRIYKNRILAGSAHLPCEAKGVAIVEELTITEPYWRNGKKLTSRAHKI